MKKRMQDFEWNIIEDQIGGIFLELEPEERAEAEENYSQYLCCVVSGLGDLDLKKGNSGGHWSEHNTTNINAIKRNS